jgi:P pilus assembly chaperone PapD
MKHLRALTPIVLALVTMLPVATAQAQEFAASISPPRFELSLKAGERSRQVIEISNAASQPATYKVYTADWTLGPDWGVTFHDALESRSCRPWVAIERREITVPAGGRFRFRFEVEPPADTPVRECRFAVMIEGAEQMARTGSGLNIPVSGRIGVIVYANVGGAEPRLQVIGAAVEDVNGQKLPVLKVNNLGNAHGRLSGFLRGTDASGRRLEFSPTSLPILPLETRSIALTASDRPGSTVQVTFPVTISGVLEWGTSGRLEINQLFGQ